MQKKKTKRGRKQDAERVSNQPGELAYVAKKKKVPKKKVKAVKKELKTVSRKRIYKALD